MGQAPLCLATVTALKIMKRNDLLFRIWWVCETNSDTGHWTLGSRIKGLCYGCLVHFVNNVNKEKSLRHLTMVAKFLDLNNCGPAVVEKKEKN